LERNNAISPLLNTGLLFYFVEILRYSGIENCLHTKKECLLDMAHLALELPFKRVIEGRIEMRGRRGRRNKQLLEDLKKKKEYWKLKGEALDRTVWRTVFLEEAVGLL
jgi:hypothetical protein